MTPAQLADQAAMQAQVNSPTYTGGLWRKTALLRLEQGQPTAGFLVEALKSMVSEPSPPSYW